MAYTIKQTGPQHDKLDILAYGLPGTQKTLSIGHLRDAGFSPLVIACDPGGLITLKKYNIPYVEINSQRDIIDFIKDVRGGKLDIRQFDFLCVDGLTNLSYICLKATGESAKDRRLDYSNYWISFRAIVDELRRFSAHFYCNCLCTDLSNGQCGAMIEGAKYSISLTGTFNTVLAMRRMQTGNVDKTTGAIESAVFIQTFDDGVYNCKDRTNSCLPYETNMGEVAIKILSIN